MNSILLVPEMPSHIHWGHWSYWTVEHSISWSLGLINFYAKFLLEKNDRYLLLLFIYSFFTVIMLFLLGLYFLFCEYGLWSFMWFSLCFSCVKVIFSLLPYRFVVIFKRILLWFQIFNGVFLKVNKATMNMLHRVEPYVTYGYVFWLPTS